MAREGDLDALVRRVDPDRWLASRFIADGTKRADVVALYAYDHELARAPKVASNALIAEIRLTWWREVLDEIYSGGVVRGHPTALALSGAVRRRDLPRAPLEAMIDARVEALDRTVTRVYEAEAWARDIGGSATLLASLIVDPKATGEMTRNAGIARGLWVLRRSGAAVDGLDARLREVLAAAKIESRKIGAPAFPAIAALALAKRELAGRRPGKLEAQVRILAAVIRGSI